MRRNIKMRVTPEQRAGVIEIARAQKLRYPNLCSNQAQTAVIHDRGLELCITGDREFDLLPLEEVDADLFIRTNGHCYQDGDVVTLGDKVSEEFQGLTGTLSNVDGDAAILDYGGERGLAIRLNWIDNSYKDKFPKEDFFGEVTPSSEKRLKDVELHVMGQKEPTLLQIPEDTLEYARSLPDEELEGIEATLNERGQRYGDFDKHAQITQDLKAVMAGTPNWQTLTPSAKEALEMIAHKIGRILNGDPTYADSWHDIAGYSTLVEKECDHA